MEGATTPKSPSLCKSRFQSVLVLAPAGRFLQIPFPRKAPVVPMKGSSLPRGASLWGVHRQESCFSVVILQKVLLPSSGVSESCGKLLELRLSWDPIHLAAGGEGHPWGRNVVRTLPIAQRTPAHCICSGSGPPWANPGRELLPTGMPSGLWVLA